jgi:hypothetical protein
MDERSQIIQRIRQNNAQKTVNTFEDRKHQQLLLSDMNTQETILKAFQALVEYMGKTTTKTELVNQLESIGTPDALEVRDAVNDLHETLKTHENTDLSEITKVMKSVLEEAKKIPKEVATLEVPSEMTVKNMPDHTADFKDLLEAVKAIKLVAEAPVVNVDAPQINIGGELKPLLDKMTEHIEKSGKAMVTQVNKPVGLINVNYDEYKIVYTTNDFDEDEEIVVSSIKYFLKSKLVATLKYVYDKKGNLIGGKRV